MLTREQIQYLYKFCEKEGVRYYDLQTELVDHLTEAIEAKIAENRLLSFDDALMNVYKEFGDGGFLVLMGEKTNILKRSARKAEIQNLKSFFTYPRIAASIVLFFALYLLTSIAALKPNRLYLLYLFIWMLVCGMAEVYSYSRLRNLKRELLCLETMVKSFIWKLLYFVPNTVYFLIIRSLKIESEFVHWNLLISVFGTLLLLSGYARYQTYKNLYEESRRSYPLAFKS